MIDDVENTLLEMGIDKNNVHSERFTTNVSGDESTTHLSAAEPVDGAKLTVHLDGETIETEVKKGKSILDTLLDLKQEPPYSCCSGSCSTCMAKVIKGKVEMEACYALDDDEIEEGFILT